MIIINVTHNFSMEPNIAAENIAKISNYLFRDGSYVNNLNLREFPFFT